MARKKDFDYFAALVKLAEKSKEASMKLLEVVKNYDLNTIGEKADEIHVLEHEGDKIVHSIMDELNHSFITPIDREDIVLITGHLDNVLDGIDSIPFQFDSYLIEEMRPQITQMAEYIVEVSEGVYVVAQEFSKFKNSKTLGNMIVHVNEIEERADILYRSLIKDLFQNEKDVIQVVKWKAIIERFEDVIDKAENSVDVLAGLVIKNT